MPTRMRHPDHGIHFALGPEIDDCIKNGWTIDVPKQKVVQDAPRETITPIVEAPDLKAQYLAKFGRPPHHRMAEATIRAALAEE